MKVAVDLALAKLPTLDDTTLIGDVADIAGRLCVSAGPVRAWFEYAAATDCWVLRRFTGISWINDATNAAASIDAHVLDRVATIAVTRIRNELRSRGLLDDALQVRCSECRKILIVPEGCLGPGNDVRELAKEGLEVTSCGPVHGVIIGPAATTIP